MCLAKDIKQRRFLGGNPSDLFILVFVLSSFSFDSNKKKLNNVFAYFGQKKIFDKVCPRAY